MEMCFGVNEAAGRWVQRNNLNQSRTLLGQASTLWSHLTYQNLSHPQTFVMCIEGQMIPKTRHVWCVSNFTNNIKKKKLNEAEISIFS